jgi:hypothetical protein
MVPAAEFSIEPRALLELLTGNLLQGLILDIGNYRGQGMTDTQIRARLRDDWNTGTGSIGGFQAQVRNQFQAAQQKFYMAGAYGDVKDESELYMWHAVGVSTCPGCLLRAGRVRTFQRWSEVGLPGAGATVCKHFCRCTLLPIEKARRLYGTSDVQELESRARQPIRDRQKEIGKSGKDYADSTVRAKLGQFRDPAVKNTDPREPPIKQQ